MALGALVVFASLFVFSRRKGPGDGAQFVVSIPPHATAQEVAASLFEAGLLSDAAWMRWYLTVYEGTTDFGGEHLLPGGTSPAELVVLMRRFSDRTAIKVTFPEGFTRFAIGRRLEEKGICTERDFVRATEDREVLAQAKVPEGAVSAEGYLFPATYDLKPNAPCDEVARLMIWESNRRWKKMAEDREAELARISAELGFSRHQIVTLASIIEKEAAVPEERATISSVFQNRLTDPSFAPKLLQSDPTSAYGCLVLGPSLPSCQAFTGKVTPQMNRDKANLYSTYAHAGLPPGPICSPSEAAVRAVLRPETTDYFYFVAKGQGRHSFSRTLDEHNAAIRR